MDVRTSTVPYGATASRDGSIVAPVRRTRQKHKKMQTVAAKNRLGGRAYWLTRRVWLPPSCYFIS